MRFSQNKNYVIVSDHSSPYHDSDLYSAPVDDLEILFNQTPHNCTSVFGLDANSCVGPASEFDSDEVLGMHGQGTRQWEGTALVEFATSAGLCIYNTYPDIDDGLNITCDCNLKASPQQIDYILCDHYLLNGRKGVCKVIGIGGKRSDHRCLKLEFIGCSSLETRSSRVFPHLLLDLRNLLDGELQMVLLRMMPLLMSFRIRCLAAVLWSLSLQVA